MIEQELRGRIDGLLDDDTEPDWLDVVERAPASVSPSAPARGMRSLVAAALVGAALAAVPAFAFSTPMHHLVGSKKSPGPELRATVTGIHIQHLEVGDRADLTFTVGEPGQRAGAGIPPNSVFLLDVIPNHGEPPRQFLKADGANGRYRATTWVPRGGIRSIQIGGWLNMPKGLPWAADGFWIPVTILNDRYSPCPGPLHCS